MGQLSNESRLLDLLAAVRSRYWRLRRRSCVKCVRRPKCWVVGAAENCTQFGPTLVGRTKMEEKDVVDTVKVNHVVPRAEAAKEACRVIRTRGVLANKGSDDQPWLPAGRGEVAQKIRG